MTGTVTTQPSFTIAEEDWHMPIESSQYFFILFHVNKVFTFYHFEGIYQLYDRINIYN